jgi:autotransporter-associated beta strand protein
MKSPSPTILQKLNRHRFPINCALVALTAFWQVTLPLQAANFYWDADGSNTSNDAVTGLNLGGAGNWDTSSNLWWDLSSMGTWPSTGNHTAIFTGAYPTLGLPVSNAVTLASGTTANQIQFLRSGYTLSGGDLTLSGPTPTLNANLGESAFISSTLLGTDGFTKTGGGSIRLSGGSYSGVTKIANGTLIISDGSALGADVSAISILTTNPTPLNGTLIGFGGGSLVLDGTASGFTFSRDINFEGRGPIGDRGAAILSIGDNTLSGVLSSAVSPLPLSPTASFRNSRINSVNGTLTLSGTLNVGGTTGTVNAGTFTSLGGVNSAGAGDFALTGVLAGTGSIEKSGAGTLFLNPSSNSSFTGTVRVSASSIGQQSSVRVTQTTVGSTSIFGANTAGNASGAIDMNGGVLEFRNEGNMDFNALASGKNVYLRANSTFYTGPAAGGEAINGLTTLGTFRVATNTTGTYNSRNGFGMTLGAWTQESSNGNTAIANNMGGTLLFTGDAWNNADPDPRNLTFSGNGNTRIAGNITATLGTGNGKQVIKQGTGELILNGTGGTFTGATIVEGGSLRITDFRSINNNTVGIRLGNASTAAGNLIIGGTGAGTGTVAGLTTSKPIVFNSTTGQSAIYANQAGVNPVILNGAITTVLTTGNYNLGGSNTADNIINVALPAATTPSATAGGLTKVGTGTWVLNAANLYTGGTSIQGGTLKLRATAAASNVILETATNVITFSAQATAQTAGGTLEFRGFSGAATTETLGALTPTAGAATIRLLGNGGSAANLTFTSLGATTAASSLNFDTSGANGGVVTLTGQTATTATNLPGSGGSQGHIYINGADFATINGSAQVVAPTYSGTGNFQNAASALVSAVHNKLTAGFTQAGATTTISSLMTNNQTLTLGGNLVVSTGGILQSGGTASILSDSATPRLINQTGTAATNIAFRVNLLADVLNLGSETNPVNIGSFTTGGMTKNGAGTLVIFGTNAQTGTTTINEGKISLNGAAARLSATSASLVVRQGATLELLTGVTAANAVVNALDGSGTISGLSGQTFTQNGGGTWNGAFTGTGLNITKGGGNATWSGVSSYTGVTTIGGTGLVTVDTLANGGVNSGIGASSSDAANLVFNGSTAGIDYRGNIIDTALTLGSRSAATDRLFTLAAAATGANLTSTASNNNAIVWSNTGAIVNNTAANAILTFAGSSTGDNTFDPQIVDSSVGGITLGVTKSGAGQWNLGASNNTYTGITTLNDGILGLNNNGALSGNSPLLLAPTSATSAAILQMSGTFERNLAATATAGSGTVTFGGTIASTTGGVGFAAHSTPLTVAIGGVGSPTALTWGSGGFVGTAFAQNLVLNSTTALSSVDFKNAIDLGALARTINVLDNANTGADYATMSGDLSGTGGSLIKAGAGVLRLTGANSYTGNTTLSGGTLVVSSLGGSTSVSTSSVGASNVTMNDANAVILGTGGAQATGLVYVGAGEESDRKIRLNATGANHVNAIYADGSGALILKNVSNDMLAGAKTLSLRGSNAAGNMITSQLSNNGVDALSVTIDGGATWILTNSLNNYSGNTTASAGALGIGDNAALGAGTLVFNNGNVFAYGADRTIANAITHNNNINAGFLGDYSLTFSSPLNLAAAANNANTTTNNIVAGKTLTFAGGVTANSLGALRAWAIDGTGETIINGNFTTSTAFGVRFDLNGGGTLTLGTNGATSNFNQTSTAVDVDRGTLKFTANNAIPNFGAATPTTTAGVTSSTTIPVSSTAGLTVGQQFSVGGTVVGRIASIDSGTQFTANIAQTIAASATLTFAASGGVILSPELATGDTATFNLNGTNQTINAFTATTDGAVVIDNTSATPATFTFGANNSAVSITNTGARTITDSGTGALSIVKTGNTALTLPTGMTLTYQGTTSSTGGGSFTINSALNGTSGLIATGNSTLALLGGLTSPGTITSIEVGGGSILSLLDGSGSAISNLTNLNLGAGTGTATLNLNVGDSLAVGDFLNTDTLTLLTGGTLNLANSITFNLTDAGLNPATTYTLLNLVDGGITAFGAGNMIQGAMPGGFSGFTWTVTNNLVQLTTGTLITGSSYWRGLTDNTWNANANNWSTDKAGTIAAASIPGSGTDVVFAYDGLAAAPLTTTLEQNIKINSLTFEAGTTTPTSVTIAPGAVSTNRLEVAPQVTTDGIKITAGGPAAVTISAPLRLGGIAASQTWNVADAASLLTLSGGLQGEKDVTKTGSGKVTVSIAADNTFNSGNTADFTVDGGTLEILSIDALGVAGKRANVVVNTGAAFYYNNATAGTVTNALTLGGGTLSAGGNNQTYSGAVNVSGNSLINMAEFNGPNTNTARNITLSGVVSGSGNLTIDSNNTVSTGNQLGGTFTINNALSTWSGDLFLNRGTFTIGALASPTVVPDDITFNSFGRFIIQGVDGQTLNRAGTLNFAAGAVGEFQVDNTTTTQVTDLTLNQNGNVTLGSAGNGATLRVALPDAFAKMNIVGSVLLGGNSSISLSNASTRLLTISGIISDGGSGYSLSINDDAGAWAQTNGIVRLTGQNTFTGNFSLGEGTAEFDTITDIGGAASSLGQGAAITMGASTLSFIGGASQATNRPITTTGSGTLSANGTSGATISYNGAITQGVDQSLTLTGTGEGFITAGITQPAGTAVADLNVSSGMWTLNTGNVTIADDLLMTGGTLNLQNMVFSLIDDVVVSNSGAILNLNSTGVMTATNVAGTSSGLHARTGGVINLNANDIFGAANSGGLDFINVGDSGAGAAGVLNTNSFNITSPGLLIGGVATGLEGNVTGTGTITVTSTATDHSLGIRTYRGSISANLAGVASLLKQGLADVTLSGNNSGLTGTVAATRIDAGNLILDYTTQNNNKISAVAALDMRGGRVTLTGNDSAATAQTVNGLTLVNASGANRLVLNPGAGQELVLNLGAITRAVNSQDGTLRIILPSGTQSATNGVTTSTALTAGLVGSAAFLTVEDITGTWFATKSGSNIVALASTPKNDVSTWLAGDHITDETTGFTGTYASVGLNSLRFNAAGGSNLNLGTTGVLGLMTGGLLITDNVSAASGMTGGTLFSGAAAATPELIFTQDSAFTHTISADIRVNHILFKTGLGTLRLTGNNVYTGVTEIQNGTLEVSGGNAIGDNSPVTLSDDIPTTLKLLANESVGRLGGGSTTDGLRNLATVDVGSFTLTTNTTGANATYSGKIIGSGTIIKNGVGTNTNWNLNNISDGFTGSIIVNGGLFQLSNIGRIDASSFTFNKDASFLIDNNSTTSSGTRILDTASFTFNSLDGAASAETRPSGLWIRRDQGSGQTETVGAINLSSGASYTRLEASVTSAVSTIIADNILRFNGSTFNVRGTNMTATTGQRAQLRIGTAGNQTTFISSMVGGGGALGTKNISIVPWGIAEEVTGTVGDGNMGNSLASYVTGVGFRALNLTTEYDTYSAATAQSNTRESLAADLTGLSGKTINSLVLNNAAIATINVTGAGSGQTLAVTSGALLFTVSGGAASTAYSTILGGFNDGITVGSTNEYVIHVVNPSSVATTSTLSASITSNLTSGADITKAGRGTLILTGTNTAGGGARRTTINEGVLEITDLDNIGGNTGGLAFAGGVLRLGTGYADDLSTRTISYFNGGGTIDTNGNSPVLANSLGSGVGGFTKSGAGNLTLNASATYTGPTLLSVGTVTVGANNALGNGGNLTLAAGSTLAFSGTNSINHGLVSASGAAWAITGNGTINASSGFSLSTTDATQVDAVLAGNGGLLKSGAQVLTLTGLNSYRGTTEVQAGTLSFNSIGNPGAGASALGNPANAEDGIIRMGLTTAATALNYTGSGHTSNRLIGMQGSTGGVTLNGNGTGAVSYGGARFEYAGNKTLTLGGTADPALVNGIGELREIGGVLTLLKTDANTWNLTASNTYTGATSVNNGVLRISAVQNHTGALNFGSANTITTAATVDVNENAAFGSLLAQTNSAVNTNILDIASGKTVTINGNVAIGSGAATSTTLFNTAGTGSFVVNNTLATGNTFLVGGSSNNAVTADFSSLPTMNVSLNPTGGTFLVSSTSGTNSTGVAILKLAEDTTITANALTVGGGGSYNGNVGQVNQLQFGIGDNVFNINNLNVGTGARDLGSLTFLNPTGGTLAIRAADGTSATAFNMGTGSANTGVLLSGNQNTFDVTGHNADLKFSAVNIGTQNRNQDLVNVFSFDTGTLEIGSLNASAKGVNGFTTTTTINLGGGTVTSGAWTLASASGDGSAVATANLTGGNITFSGHISRGADAVGGGTATGTVNLNGANLNMSGSNIGDATNQIVFNAMSGTLSGLNQLNGGGALTKTTAGVLVMGAANAYTGPTNVNDGTLQVGVTGVGTTGSGLVTVVKTAATYANAAIISGSGTIQGAVVVGDIANALNRGILSPGDGTHLTANATLTISAAGGLTVAAGSQTLLGLTTATGTDAAFAASGMTASAYLASLSSTSDGAVGTAPAAWFAQPSGGATDFLNLTNVAGTLTLGTNSGTAAAGEGIMSIFNNGLNLASLAPGQIFNLVDWYGAFSGGFNAGSTYSTGGINGDFDLPDIASTGYSWDVSAFTSHGVLAVSTYIIPEPSRAMLMLFGMMLLALRRRRNVA